MSYRRLFAGEAQVWNLKGGEFDCFPMVYIAFISKISFMYVGNALQLFSSALVVMGR